MNHLWSIFFSRRSSLQRELRLLVHGETATAERLLRLEQQKEPGMPEDGYLEKVIYDLQRRR